MIKAAVLLALIASPAYCMDDITIAGVYSVDRATCNLSIDQREIDRALMSAMWTKDMSRSEAVMEAARIGTVLERQVVQSGRVAEYCEARRMK